MYRTRIAALALLAAAPLGVAACSSSGNHLNIKAPAAHKSGSGSAPVAAGGSSAPAASGGSGWCHELEAAGSAIIAVGGDQPMAPSEYKQKLHQLVNDAPSDIKPDLQVVEKIDDQMVDGNANADEAFGTDPKAMSAAQHLVQWLTTNCPDVVASQLPSDLPTGLPTNLSSEIDNAFPSAAPTS